LLPHFESCIKQLISKDNQWQFVRLQALQDSPHTIVQSLEDFDLARNHTDPLGATAYLIKPQAAEKLIVNSKYIYEPLDHYLEHVSKHGQDILAVLPYPVDITKVISTISDRPNDRKPVQGIHKKLRSLYRFIDRNFSKEPWFPR
jgi:glycosyl transferase family 25